MNAPFTISPAFTRKQGETPAEALDRVVAELEAGGHLPKPPTPEEIARAEAKADEAMRSLVAPLLSDDELRKLSRGHRQFNRSRRA
jgi:hypothetical protein